MASKPEQRERSDRYYRKILAEINKDADAVESLINAIARRVSRPKKEA